MYEPNKFFKGRRFHPLKVLFFLTMGALFVAVIGYVVMWLWNAILPDVANVKPISYWQAVGLFILFKILLGGFRRGRHGHRGRSRRGRWKEKWMSMNEEERAEFKGRWKAHCGKRETQQPEKGPEEDL